MILDRKHCANDNVVFLSYSFTREFLFLRSLPYWSPRIRRGKQRQHEQHQHQLRWASLSGRRVRGNSRVYPYSCARQRDANASSVEVGRCGDRRGEDQAQSCRHRRQLGSLSTGGRAVRRGPRLLRASIFHDVAYSRQ